MTDQEFQAEAPPLSRKKTRGGSLILGLCLAIFLPIGLGLGLRFLNVETFGLMLIVIGLSQLIYIIPLIIYYKYKKATRTIQGLLIGAGFIFLINAACFGFVMSDFRLH